MTSRRLITATLSAFLLASFTACGGNSTSSATPSTNPQAAILAFTQCMRSHGVNVPDPSGGGNGPFAVKISGSGTNPSTLQAAQQACQKYMPQIGGNGSATPDPARQAELLKYTQCMRDHGVNLPDPQSSGNGTFISIGGGPNGSVNSAQIDPNSPTFQSAQKACQSDLPGAIGGGPALSAGSGGGAGFEISGGGGSTN